jgi:hypothetical protein
MARELDVQVRGLRQLDRALGATDKALRRKLRDRLKQAAAIAAEATRELIESKDLIESGDMLGSVRPFAAGATGRKPGSGGVIVSATHRGYAYPKRLEYEGRDSSGYGPRAFVHPAIQEVSGEIVADLTHLLDDLEHDFGGSPNL